MSTDTDHIIDAIESLSDHLSGEYRMKETSFTDVYAVEVSLDDGETTVTGAIVDTRGERAIVRRAAYEVGETLVREDYDVDLRAGSSVDTTNGGDQ